MITENLKGEKREGLKIELYKCNCAMWRNLTNYLWNYQLIYRKHL